MQFICFNNKIIPKNELGFYDVERFRVADACFESILLVGGRIPLLSYHQDRLDQACKLFGFDSYSINESQIKDLAEKNGLVTGMNRTRLSLIRASGHNYTPFNSDIKSLIECEEIKSICRPINNLGVFPNFTKHANTIGGVKHANALLYVLAKQYARENEFDEVIILNENGQFIETASSNLFIVKDGQIFTSKADSGCVLGVCRKFIINFFGAQMVELSESFVKSADEIFLSNAVQLIQSVKNYKGMKLETKQTNQLINKIKTELAI